MTAKKFPKKTPEPQPYDPFSYPRLYPSGWNLDEMGSDPGQASKKKKMPERYEPFHELRTFPSGWDLS